MLPILKRTLTSQTLTPKLFSTSAIAMGLPSPVAPNTPKVPNQGSPKIHLYTAGTPNGYKPSICLEELRLAYPDLAKTKLSYDVYSLNIPANEQKDPTYLKINPNGRIPAIVDDNAGVNIFESANILIWLGEQYDSEYTLTFKDVRLRAEMMNWIIFAQGGPGPMLGQLGWFTRNPKKIPFAIKRYADESERLLSVYEEALRDTEYLVGGRYSLADMNAFTWVSIYPVNCGIDMAKYPRVLGWIERIAARPAVKEGLKVPVEWAKLSAEEQRVKREELEKYREAAESV